MEEGISQQSTGGKAEQHFEQVLVLVAVGLDRDQEQDQERSCTDQQRSSDSLRRKNRRRFQPENHQQTRTITDLRLDHVTRRRSQRNNAAPQQRLSVWDDTTSHSVDAQSDLNPPASRAPLCPSSLPLTPSSPSPLHVSSHSPYALEQLPHVSGRVRGHESGRGHARGHESGRGHAPVRGRVRGRVRGHVRGRGHAPVRGHVRGRVRVRGRAPPQAGWPQRSTCWLHETSSPESRESDRGGHHHHENVHDGDHGGDRGDGDRGRGHRGNGCERQRDGRPTAGTQTWPVSVPADEHRPCSLSLQTQRIQCNNPANQAAL